MTSYYKIAKWIIGQDVEHSINSEDIKEIAKEEFGVSLTKSGIKKVKEELLKQGYNQKINDSSNDLWKVSVDVHNGHAEFMTKEDYEKGNSIIDRFAELYGVKKQATFFKDFYIGSEPDVKLFADAVETRLDDYLWIVGQPSQVTEKDREKLNIKDAKLKDSVLDLTWKEAERYYGKDLITIESFGDNTIGIVYHDSRLSDEDSDEQETIFTVDEVGHIYWMDNGLRLVDSKIKDADFENPTDNLFKPIIDYIYANWLTIYSDEWLHKGDILVQNDKYDVFKIDEANFVYISFGTRKELFLNEYKFNEFKQGLKAIKIKGWKLKSISKNKIKVNWLDYPVIRVNSIIYEKSNNIKDSIFTKEPLEYILEELDKEGIAYEVTEDEYGFDAPLYATITILDPNDSNLADEIICNQVGYAYEVVRDREGNKKAFKVATDPEDIDSINNTGIKDSKFKDEIPEFTEKDKEAVRQWFLEVFEKVYTEAPLNISMLNILNNDDYFLGIFAGMYDILEDMRYNMSEKDETKRAELKELYRRGKRLYNRYSMRKFKDSADWETLKKSKDFVLKRLFEELEQEKARPMSVEKENNIADIKSQIRKRAKEVRHVPNDIYDSKSNVGKKISWDRRALYGTILSENDPLTNKTTIEESSTGKVYFVSTRLLNKAIENGEAKIRDSKLKDSGDVEYVVYDYTGNDYYCESLEEVKDTIKGLKDYACIEAYFPNGKEHFETYEELENFISDYENYKLEDAKLEPTFERAFKKLKNYKYRYGSWEEGIYQLKHDFLLNNEEISELVNRLITQQDIDEDTAEQIKNFCKDSNKNIEDANLTRKQKLWYAEELQKFIEPQYLRRNYQLRRLKNKRRRK